MTPVNYIGSFQPKWESPSVLLHLGATSNTWCTAVLKFVWEHAPCDKLGQIKFTAQKYKKRWFDTFNVGVDLEQF